MTRLELTWIGKNDPPPRLEPRILLEQPEHHTAHPTRPGPEGILIHGDNLLALKALERRFAGQVKCIYIDPPYNTGSAFEHYDDGLEHSLWLSLISQRLRLLHSLLADDGTIFISIDNNEVAYLQVLMDEIFGRTNRKNIIVIKRGSVTGAKVINPGLVNISEFILVYAKDAEKWKPNRIMRMKDRDSRYGTFIENFEEGFSKWKFSPLMETFAQSVGLKKNLLKKKFGENLENEVDDFILKNAYRVIRFASLDEKSISKEAVIIKHESIRNPSIIHLMEREEKKPYYIFNGSLILFVKDRLSEIDGEMSFSEPLSDIWDDVLPNDLHNEGGVEFRKGKKPEKLVQRLLEIATNENDLILDSFLGSGTTAAVAHKMGRRWIGIELGQHAYTHCLPRLQKVVSGADQGGISKAVGWGGGGSFRTYRLAPSLLRRDPHGLWVIEESYDAEQLAAAVALHEGYEYQPDPLVWWRQSRSTERDWLLVTTRHVDEPFVRSLADELPAGETLRICCRTHAEAAERADGRISIKKIPALLLGRCEFGRDDYSFSLKNLSDGPTVFVESEPPAPVKKASGMDGQPTLFS